MLEGHRRSKGIGWKVLGNHPSSKVATPAVSREGEKWGKLAPGVPGWHGPAMPRIRAVSRVGLG